MGHRDVSSDGIMSAIARTFDDCRNPPPADSICPGASLLNVRSAPGEKGCEPCVLRKIFVDRESPGAGVEQCDGRARREEANVAV